jgi:hypothetical protein
MADNGADESDQKDWPGWVKSLLRLMAIVGALVGAIALIVTGVGNVWEGVGNLCKSIGICGSATPVPEVPKAAAVPPPQLPNLSTDWVEGGHTAQEYCNPQKAAYEKQYPNFTIEMTILGDENRKDFLGHVTYRFHCAFAAKTK